MMNVQVWSEAMRSAEIKEALLTVTFDTLCQAFAELFREAQEQGTVDPQLDSQALAITVMGMFHGLVLHKSLDPEIDMGRPCGHCIEVFSGLWPNRNNLDPMT